MKLKTIILCIFCLLKLPALSQKAEIDSYCVSLDSLIASGSNIVCFTIDHKTEFDSSHLLDRFYIDTSKRTLIKSIYDFNFYKDGEFLEVYYQSDVIVKVNARHQLDERKFKGTYYFKDGKLVGQVGGEISPGKTVFDIQQILKTGTQHLRTVADMWKSPKAEYSLKTGCR